MRDIISYPFPNFNGGLAKPPLKSVDVYLHRIFKVDVINQ